MFGKILSIIILVLILIIMISGYVAYRKVRNKVREFSRMAFGTEDIKEGFQKVEKEAEVTPKSVSAATSLYLPQIMRDFPEFHLEEMKNKAENVLTSFLQCVDRKSMNDFAEGTTSELKEKLRMRIANLDSEGAEQHYRNIRIHRTEIKSYRKLKGKCSIVFQSSIQYNYYLERGGKVVEGSRDRLKQSRYNVEMLYIQDASLLENAEDMGLAMNCPNCGGPLPKLGAKTCMYCGSPILEFNTRIWNFSDVEEG
ncbi:MAG: TIM44-like domain-containing protein [Acetatifactor sp.]